MKTVDTAICPDCEIKEDEIAVLKEENIHLKEELECYKLNPDEKTELISKWQKNSFAFEDENYRLRKQIAALKAEVKRLREAVALKEVASHTQRVCGRPSSSKDDKGFPTTTATSARSTKGPGRGFSGHY